jgi:hypothetical protein
LGVKRDSFGAYIGGQRIEPGCGGPGAIKRSPIRITNLRRAFTRAPLLAEAIFPGQRRQTMDQRADFFQVEVEATDITIGYGSSN